MYVDQGLLTGVRMLATFIVWPARSIHLRAEYLRKEKRMKPTTHLWVSNVFQLTPSRRAPADAGKASLMLCRCSHPCHSNISLNVGHSLCLVWSYYILESDSGGYWIYESMGGRKTLALYYPYQRGFLARSQGRKWPDCRLILEPLNNTKPSLFDQQEEESELL